jgi:hypothetical protein
MHTRGRRKIELRTLLLAVLVSIPSRGVSSTSWNVSCCSVFKALTQFTVERTGSSLSDTACRADERQCMDLKLIGVFIKQSRTILGTSNIKTSTEHNFIQFVLENDINDREAHVIDLLAWAFIGRIIALPTATPDVNRQSVLLQYDVQGDQLTIKRDSCQIDKTLYNTMVLGSVTLLIFFISAMVVEKKRHEKQDQVSPKTPAHEPEKVPGKTDSLMRSAHIFGPLVPPQRPSRETQAFRFEHSRSKSPFAHHA